VRYHDSPIYYVYRGGTSGAVPPSDDDTVKAAAAAMRRVEVEGEAEPTKAEHPPDGSPINDPEPSTPKTAEPLPEEIEVVFEEFDP
jgi:hypothetical protein